MPETTRNKLTKISELNLEGLSLLVSEILKRTIEKKLAEEKESTSKESSGKSAASSKADSSKNPSGVVLVLMNVPLALAFSILAFGQINKAMDWSRYLKRQRTISLANLPLEVKIPEKYQKKTDFRLVRNKNTGLLVLPWEKSKPANEISVAYLDDPHTKRIQTYVPTQTTGVEVRGQKKSLPFPTNRSEVRRNLGIRYLPKSRKWVTKDGEEIFFGRGDKNFQWLY